MALLWRDIAWRAKGQRRSLGSLLNHYLAVRVLGWLGRRQRRRLESDTRAVQRVQEETLLGRLRKNAETSYGRLHGFGSIQDGEVFRERHPLTGYEDYRELVERVAGGEAGVLTAERPSVLALTSGTSGSSSMLLSTRDTSTEFFLQGVAVCLDAMHSAYPVTQSLQRTAKFFYNPTWHQSEAGIPIGPNSSTPRSSRQLLSLYTTPAPAFEVPTEPEALYLHLLFAVKDPSLGTLESNFACTIYYAFCALQERWRELAEDVELGRVRPELAVPQEVRRDLDSRLRPDPARAAQLRAQCETGFQGIARRLWPRLNLVLTVDSGSNHVYGELLRRHYCQGVPFYSPFYAATEGLIGVNLWPERERRQYLLCPRSMFCEFIPEESLEERQPGTLLLHQVQEGQQYELVVTNAAGLYSLLFSIEYLMFWIFILNLKSFFFFAAVYRLGDVVRVVGFHNQCPVVEFQYRRGQMLSVRGEKVSEELFYGALQRAVSLWPGAELIDYCCAESGILGHFSGGSDPHYQVFLELRGVRNLSEEQRYKKVSQKDEKERNTCRWPKCTFSQSWSAPFFTAPAWRLETFPTELAECLTKAFSHAHMLPAQSATAGPGAKGRQPSAQPQAASVAAPDCGIGLHPGLATFHSAPPSEENTPIVFFSSLMLPCPQRVNNSFVLFPLLTETRLLHRYLWLSQKDIAAFLQRAALSLSRPQLDHCLQEDSAIYKSFRFKGSIGPMRVQLVRGGAFQELRSHMLASSQVCPNTFKMHRVLRRKEFVQFIQGRIIS
ncbi:GHDC protein, partial [Atractosteus spatula]|nr:GHDC protein [Atractosteus spatula]